MGGTIFGNIVFLANQMKNGGMPDKCFFLEQRYGTENFLYVYQNNTARFVKPARLSSVSLRGNPAGIASRVWSDDYLFMCSLLLVCSPGAALCGSAVCGISAWSNFYSRIKWKKLERAGSERNVGLPFLGLCQWPHSFNTHPSLQWRLCVTAHFRKEILQLLISPVPIPSHPSLSP